MIPLLKKWCEVKKRRTKENNDYGIHHLHINTVVRLVRFLEVTIWKKSSTYLFLTALLAQLVLGVSLYRVIHTTHISTNHSNCWSIFFGSKMYFLLYLKCRYRITDVHLFPTALLAQLVLGVSLCRVIHTTHISTNHSNCWSIFLDPKCIFCCTRSVSTE